MKVNGCNCSLVIKTTQLEMDIPYSDETIREAVSLLEEEAAIEGNGNCSAIRKMTGVTGCVVTPLTIDTAPLLFFLAMGSVWKPVYVSGTRNLYRYSLDILPMEDTIHFNLIQKRGEERRLFVDCRVKSFELRVLRDEAVKLKLEITSDRQPIALLNTESFYRECGERFSGNYVTYRINGKDYQNIYGITLVSKKEGGTKTELWIKRALEQEADLPHFIDEIIIIGKLLRDKYEGDIFGTFSITLKNLFLKSDETQINSVDTVIGPLRYYVSGLVSAETMSSEELGMRNEQ